MEVSYLLHVPVTSSPGTSRWYPLNVRVGEGPSYPAEIRPRFLGRPCLSLLGYVQGDANWQCGRCWGRNVKWGTLDRKTDRKLQFYSSSFEGRTFPCGGGLGWGSIFGKAICYGLDVWGSNPVWARDSLFVISIQTGCGGPSRILHHGCRGSFQGVKRPGHGFDNLSPSSAEVKSWRSCSSASPLCVPACLVTGRL